VTLAEELAAARRAGLPADDIVHGNGGERLVVGHAWTQGYAVMGPLAEKAIQEALKKKP